MPDYKIRINTDNAAFNPPYAPRETARILRTLADRIERVGARAGVVDGVYRAGVIDAPINLRDINGNKVGYAGWV